MRIRLPEVHRFARGEVAALSCDSCRLKAVGVLRETGGGRRYDQGFRMGSWKYWRARWRVASCPRPANPRCACQVHRHLGGEDADEPWREVFGLDRLSAFALVPVSRPRPSASRIAPTPNEIRSAGFRWPPTGAETTAFATDPQGRVDLDAILKDLRRSLALWQREQNAAAGMAREASRISFGDHGEYKEARRNLAAKLVGLRGAIAQVERILARLDRTSPTARTEAPPPGATVAPAALPREKAVPNRGRWLRRLVWTYVLAAVIGAGWVAPAFFGVPSALPRLTWSETMTEVKAAQEAERIRALVQQTLPKPADWLAASALFWFEDRTDTLVSPSDWARKNVSLRARVDALNRSIDDILREYWSLAWLTAAIFGSGLVLGLLALWRQPWVLVIAMFAVPLFSTPIATGPLIGVEDMRFVYWTLPMILAGGGILLIHAGRAIRVGLAGRQGDYWMSLWLGALLVLVGGAVTLAGAFWVAEQPGGAVLFTAVGPALYGLYHLGRGVWGLIRSTLRVDRERR